MITLIGCRASNVAARAGFVLLSLLPLAALAQLTDATQTVPHVPGGAIAKSLAEQVGGEIGRASCRERVCNDV